METAFRRAAAYKEGVAARLVKPQSDYHDMRARFAGDLPETGSPDCAVINALADIGDAGLMHVAHPRFFGSVMGGLAPVGVAVDWLVSALGAECCDACFVTHSGGR